MSLFPFTRPVVTTVLLLTLTTILTVTQDQEFDEAYYKPLPPGYSFGYLQTNTVQRFYYRQSLLECAFYALQSQSEFFTYNEVSHVCKNYSPKNIMTVVSTNDTNESSFYRKRKWIKAYFLSMGAGSLVYNSFMNIGNPSTWKVEKCVDNFCPNFFRNPILDFWSDLPIEEVKLVIYKIQTAVVDMVFDGRNTTLESWFSPEKLISSPWSDLFAHSHNYFSIRGAFNRRNFYISAYHGGCEGDTGWLAVLQKYYCTWEIFPHYPLLIYSNRSTKVTWYDGFETADSMAIFIRLKP